MNHKKILIVSRSFFPMNTPRSFRTTELVKEFARQGHEVKLYTHKNNKHHIKFEKEHGVEIKDLGKLKFKKIGITKGGKYYIYFKRGLNRLLLQLFEYPAIELMFQVIRALKKESEYDLLISIAVPFPIHWGVAWARKKNHRIARKWVADCGDAFYFNIHDSFNKLFYFQYIEKWYSRKADYITLPFEGLKKYFFKEFENKYRIIPQGFNFNEVEINHKEINNEVITFGYAGGFMRNSRDPRKFLDFLLTVEKPFKFIIYNQQNEFTDPYKEELGDKIEVHPYIPRKELLVKLSEMDFLVNFEFDITNQAPSKLIDYSFTKRPILLIKNKEFNTNRIHEFFDKNYINQFKLESINKFNIEKVTQQFLDLIG